MEWKPTPAQIAEMKKHREAEAQFEFAMQAYNWLCLNYPGIFSREYQLMCRMTAPHMLKLSPMWRENPEETEDFEASFEGREELVAAIEKFVTELETES